MHDTWSCHTEGTNRMCHCHLYHNTDSWGQSTQNTCPTITWGAQQCWSYKTDTPMSTLRGWRIKLIKGICNKRNDTNDKERRRSRDYVRYRERESHLQGGISGVSKYFGANGRAVATCTGAELSLHGRVGIVITILDDKIHRRTSVQVLEELVKIIIQI